LTGSRNPLHGRFVNSAAARGGTAHAVRGSLSCVSRWAPLVLWFCAVVVLMAALALNHVVSLAGPERQDARLAAGLRALLADERVGWASFHVLYTECQCSQRIFAHLLASQRPADLHEIVLLVGADHALARRLEARGFEVVAVAPEGLAARFGIEGAPTFVLVDPTRAVRYLGGYTQRKQGPDLRDLAIVRDTRLGADLADLPVFGCAVSERLKAIFDPLAIRR
jgi:hypothetical protein